LRWIQKGPENALLAQFRLDASSAPETYTYANFREKMELARDLAREQRGLCAYTMRQILDQDGNVDAHLEHIISQEQSLKENHPELALDHNNIIACFPRPNRRTVCTYGAQRKGHHPVYLGQNFVSPLQRDCETLFLYDFDGSVRAAQRDAAAEQTIEILNLNDPHELGPLRRAMIEGMGLSPLADPPASAEELEVLAGLLDDALPRLPEYVVALRQCLHRFREFLLDVF